jgi:hypothetical protein
MLTGLAVAGAGAVALTGLAVAPASAAHGDPVLQGENNNTGSDTTTINSTNAIGLAVTTGLTSETLHVGDSSVNDEGDLSVLTNADFTAYVECRNQISSAGDKGGSAIYADGFMAPAIVVDAREGLPDGQIDPTNVKAGLGILVRGHNSSPGVDIATQAASCLTAVQTGTKTKANGATVVTHGLGAAIRGDASVNGRGGVFSGAQAQVRLVPDAKAKTHPAKGLAGDLFVDASHRLWFCKNPGTWVQLA